MKHEPSGMDWFDSRHLEVFGRGRSKCEYNDATKTDMRTGRQLTRKTTIPKGVEGKQIRLEHQKERWRARTKEEWVNMATTAMVHPEDSNKRVFGAGQGARFQGEIVRRHKGARKYACLRKFVCWPLCEILNTKRTHLYDRLPAEDGSDAQATTHCTVGGATNSSLRGVSTSWVASNERKRAKNSMDGNKREIFCKKRKEKAAGSQGNGVFRPPLAEPGL